MISIVETTTVVELSLIIVINSSLSSKISPGHGLGLFLALSLMTSQKNKLGYCRSTWGPCLAELDHETQLSQSNLSLFTSSTNSF